MGYQDRLQQKMRVDYQGKNILILGFGREGRTSYHFLRRLLPEQKLTIMDEHAINLMDSELAGDNNLQFLTGENYLKGLDAFDLIFKTPGLPGFRLAGVPAEKITSQTNEFVRQVGSRVIGITGTKGKSTTSTLVYECLRSFGEDVLLVGNIGKPALELLLEDVENRWYVYEMSSHQTEFLQFTARIGVVLNLFEEHLDNYTGYEAYKEAKLKIGKAMFELADVECKQATGGEHSERADESQANRHLFIYGCDNAELKSYAGRWQNCHSMATGYWQNRDGAEGVFLRDGQIVLCKRKGGEETVKTLGTSQFPRNLLGEHNLVNALVTFLVTEELFGLNEDRIAHIYEVISKFKGLEHRLEYVGVHHGIHFYNDSISTIPAAAMQAIAAIPNLQTLIIGGFDRGIYYQDFIQELNIHPELHIICLPNTGHKLFDGLNHSVKYKVENIEQAVQTAYQITDKGKSCVLSPAAASYTFYKNFEERGKDFKEKVHFYGE